MSGWYFFMGKRGAAPKSATSAVAGLILLIALFFLVYLLLLPEEAREDVLKGEGLEDNYWDENGGGDSGVVLEKKTLLLKEPGRVLPSSKENIEKEFPSINLFSTTDRETRKLANVISISGSILGSDYEDVDFIIDNVENLEKLSLFFNIIKAQGKLIIQLNSKTIFEGNLDSSNIPIEVPVVNLRNGRNRLKFIAPSPGWAFLSSNKFVLKDLELIKEFRLTNKKEVRRFEVARAEAMDDVSLEFFVNCLELYGEQGILKVYLNRRQVFFGKIVCDASQTKFDVNEDYFNDGTNYLTFEIDKGNYIIERIKLSYDYDEGFNPIYYFTLSEEEFDAVEEGDRRVILKMRFGGEFRRKRADIRINDRTLYLDTNLEEYEKDISDYVVEGENFIKIFARKEFDIAVLEIMYED